MRHVTICVVPFGGGWAVEQEGLTEPLVLYIGRPGRGGCAQIGAGDQQGGHVG